MVDVYWKIVDCIFSGERVAIINNKMQDFFSCYVSQPNTWRKIL